MKTFATTLGWLCCLSLALAADAAEEEQDGLSAPPQLPPQVQSGDNLEPEVTIIQTDKGTVREYRINGQIYMVKIQPAAGPAYYLLDTDGDGILDAERNSVWNTSIPQWVLFSW